MVNHQVVYVVIFALLDFVDLDLHSQRQLLLQVFHLLLIDGDKVLLVGF